MATLTALILLLLLIAAGIHISISLGIVAVTLMLFNFAVPPAIVAQIAWSSVDKYSLAAIPFFIFAGNLMSRGQLALVMLDLFGTVLRSIRGGVAVGLALAAVFFAAVNGSSVACAAALGPSAVKILPREGYTPPFAAAVVAVFGTLGLMIPPSLTFILIGSIVGLPITDLFIAGIIPGLMEAVLLTGMTLYLSRMRGYGNLTQRPDWQGFARRLPRASGACLMPVIVIGTIYAGLFTPTEVSALVAIYALFLVLIVYRTASLSDVWDTTRTSLLQSVMIYAILMGAGLLTGLLTRLGFTNEIAAFLNISEMPLWVFLLAVNLLLLVIGMLLDGVSMIVLLSPIVFPLAMEVGVDPIHMAVIMTAQVEIATLTPPIGLNLFVMSRVSGVPVHSITKAIIPFYGMRIFALLLLNAFPQISLYLVK